jgi:hypothetical protein
MEMQQRGGVFKQGGVQDRAQLRSIRAVVRAQRIPIQATRWLWLASER